MPDGPETRAGWAKRASARLEVLLFAAGCAFLAVLLARMGVEPVERAFRLAGIGLPLVLLPQAAVAAAATLSWRAAIDRGRRGAVPFPRLAAAWLAGDALNYAVPAGTLGGEPTKARLISPAVGTEAAVASVAVARLTEILALLAFGILGALALAPALGRDPAAEGALAAGLAAVAVAGGGIFALGRRAPGTRAVGIVERLGLPGARVARLRAFAAGLDAHLRRFLERDGRGLAASTAWRLLAWLLNVVELWVVLRLLGLRASVGTLLGIEGLAALFNAVFFFVPARAGSAEGGRVLIFTLAGHRPEDGLAVAVLRRLRETVWVAVGLALLGVLAWRARAAARSEAPVEPEPRPALDLGTVGA